MCGGGLTWTYKPTPQPGDFVRAKVCSKCGKRTKPPVTIEYTKVVYTKGRRVRVNKDGEIAFNARRKPLSGSSRRKTIHSCCSLHQITVFGQVERTVWSYYRDGTVKDFFLIVFVPILGRRHWATLDTVELVNANDHLINNVPED